MNSKVFFIGDVALDKYYRTSRFPSLKEKVICQALPPQMGGMIANAACVFAAYGGHPYFLTALNGGPISQIELTDLQDLGIDISYMIRDDSLPDSETIIILAEGEHTVFIPTMGITQIEIPKETLNVLRSADYIYSNFCEMAPLACGELHGIKLLRSVRDAGCKIWCDLDVADISKDELKLFEVVDTLFINEKGQENLISLIGADPINWLFTSGVQQVVVTLAERGCELYRQDVKPCYIKGIEVETVDVTGAGDTFCSSFLYATQKSDDVELCLSFANIAAARAVTGMGGRFGAKGTKVVFDFMEQQGIDSNPFEVFRGEYESEN